MATQQIQGQNSKIGTDAIVVGASIAGVLTARVLSDYFQKVTLIERDKINDWPEVRKGQPQAPHAHGLLARGHDGILSRPPRWPAGGRRRDHRHRRCFSLAHIRWVQAPVPQWPALPPGEQTSFGVAGPPPSAGTSQRNLARSAAGHGAAAGRRSRADQRTHSPDR